MLLTPDEGRKNMAKAKGRVHTQWDPFDFEHVAPGYMLPRELHADADLSDGVRAEVEIAVVDGRAIARKVAVEVAGGVNAAALRRVPVRDILATAALTALMHVEPQPDGSFRAIEVGRAVEAGQAQVDEVRQIVQRLVGYEPNLERLQGKVEVGRP
jgi:hypothetical protein